MTLSVIAWPGHMSEISRNQPSVVQRGQHRCYYKKGRSGIRSIVRDSRFKRLFWEGGWGNGTFDGGMSDLGHLRSKQ